MLKSVVFTSQSSVASARGDSQKWFLCEETQRAIYTELAWLLGGR